MNPGTGSSLIQFLEFHFDLSIVFLYISLFSSFTAFLVFYYIYITYDSTDVTVLLV